MNGWCPYHQRGRCNRLTHFRICDNIPQIIVVHHTDPDPPRKNPQLRAAPRHLLRNEVHGHLFDQGFIFPPLALVQGRVFLRPWHEQFSVPLRPDLFGASPPHFHRCRCPLYQWTGFQKRYPAAKPFSRTTSEI